MESWEILWSYTSLCIVLLIAFIHLYNTNLNYISIMVILFVFIFIGCLLWFGKYANPGIQMLPSLITDTTISFKTLFMIIWSICLTAKILLADTFRRLHAKYNRNGQPIHLGGLKYSIESLYGLIITTTLLLLLQMFVMIWFEASTIEIMIQKYGFNNMLIIYFVFVLVLSLIELYSAYKIYKNNSFINK